jgi:hypothetical protein
MRLRSNLKWIIAAALVAYASSPAGAQPGPPSPSGPGGNGNQAGQLGNAGAGGAADAQVGFQRRQILTPAEQLNQTDAMMTRMEGAANGVRKQLQQAREQRDVVKTLCLNDKLSQADVAIRSARDRKTNLQAAAARNDVELSNHEFTILTVLRQRAEQLTAEANQCIGEEAAFIGETKVSTQIDPTLPPSDDTQYPSTDPTLISGPPYCTSCTR